MRVKVSISTDQTTLQQKIGLEKNIPLDGDELIKIGINKDICKTRNNSFFSLIFIDGFKLYFEVDHLRY
jgi:hypothetical protein